MKNIPEGIYDLLHTKALQKRLEKAGLLDKAVWKNIDSINLSHHISLAIAHEVSSFISDSIIGKKDISLTKALNEIFVNKEVLTSIINEIKPVSISTLQEVKHDVQNEPKKEFPDTDLSVSALLTGSSRSPALRTQLIKELTSCDKADWLVSFIKYAGIVPLLPVLREFTQTPLPGGEPKLRIATTSYMGATDLKAIEALLELPNTEIRISYDTKRTRLHAKAYIFHRNTGFGSAYIGSANISKAALDEGLEWTVKISQYEIDYLWKNTIATFESHWEDESEFTLCEIDDLSILEKSLSIERGDKYTDGVVSFFDLRPYRFQQVILEDLNNERQDGKNKHLVIAATGTGKTMISAFDYKQFCSQKVGRPRLLFVAHREEILKQACSSFRQVLRDGNFGDIVIGGANLSQDNHLFCSVQSWNSRSFDKYDSNYFEYIVLDEAHHASAKSYQKLITHIKPKSLLGLTATPERSDGADIRDDFGGAFTHEIRLPEAIERALLTPFHYYGIPDLDGLDFSTIAWKRGGYEITQLKNQLEGNVARARWVMDQTEKYVTNIEQVRCLGFCVSISHANFMASYCKEHKIRAIALSSESTKESRFQAQRQLDIGDINFIFTVDLYNEGIDIPSVDTVLFLRPTESLTLFLQQLGRGLRLHEEKANLTVLDFIAPQHRNFSYTKRIKALTSRPDLRIDKQIETGMPFIPTGCLFHLEKKAKEHVLNNIRNGAAGLRGERFINELKQLRNHKKVIHLQDMIDHFHLDSPDEIYKKGLPHILISNIREKNSDANLLVYGDQLSKGFRRLALMDDTHLIYDAKSFINTGICKSILTKSLIYSVLWGSKKPENGSLNASHNYFVSRKGLKRDLIELFDWLLENRKPLIQKQFNLLTGPLTLHASYTRNQILLALGLGSFKNPKSSREGVLHIPNKKIDVFFADINKSEADFSPTTMYDDYAITNTKFHWQSQSQTSDTSPVGRRYIEHKKNGYTPLLFIRDRKQLSNGLTSPYFFAGPLQYQKHEGSKPISFVWGLDHALPEKVMPWASRIG